MTIVFLEANSTGTTAAGIRLAASSGYDTAFVTGDPVFYERSVDNPLHLADAVLNASTYDPLSVLRAVRRLDVEAIISFDDYHLSIAASCASELNLPHADISGLLATRFKDVMRERTFDCAGTVGFSTIAPGTQFDTHPPYPVVVKPVDESGSVGVCRCDTPDELAQAVSRFDQHIVNARGYRPNRTLIVEQYIVGDEYSCELIWNTDTDEWKVCGITRKILGPEPYFVEVGHLFPARLDQVSIDLVVHRVTNWLHAVGLRCGAAHVEFRLASDGPRLIEINPRLPGGHITDLVHRCTGIDMVAAYLRFHLADRTAQLVSKQCPPRAVTAATRHILASEISRPGAVEALRNTSLPSLRHFKLGEIDTLEPPVVDVSNYDRFGYLLLASDNTDAVSADLDTIHAALQRNPQQLITGSVK